jgi:hypothetical protein
MCSPARTGFGLGLGIQHTHHALNTRLQRLGTERFTQTLHHERKRKRAGPLQLDSYDRGLTHTRKRVGDPFKPKLLRQHFGMRLLQQAVLRIMLSKNIIKEASRCL